MILFVNHVHTRRLAQRRALVLSAAQARLADPNVPRCISTPLLEKQTKKRHESGHEHENERRILWTCIISLIVFFSFRH